MKRRKPRLKLVVVDVVEPENIIRGMPLDGPLPSTFTKRTAS